MAAVSQRIHFETDGASLAGSPDHEQAPALSSSGALARFEFETGCGNEGTKVLMVEWDDGRDTTDNLEAWTVSWEGKRTLVASHDGADHGLHRLYFLLAPNSPIPRAVNISQKGGKTMQTNPLPAIFPPELGTSGGKVGKKGVLHTVWGKQRLSVLQKEIEQEMKLNSEGVALDMAIRERDWIVSSFGIGLRSAVDSADVAASTSPKTPGGGRLAEKLKGLKLGTSQADLSGRSTAPNLTSRNSNPLSPDVGDVAVSSFSAFHGTEARPSARAVAQNPPQYLHARHPSAKGAMGSLNALANERTTEYENDNDEEEDGLFAVTISPRSPEMTKSPFSFSTQDIVP